MQEYLPRNARRDLLHMAAHEEAMDFGFTKAVMVNIPGSTTRELRLLGPDSPTEYCYQFDRRMIDQRWLDDLTRDIVWFIRRMGGYRKAYCHGQYPPQQRAQIVARRGPGHAGRDDQD
jgi:hypothetical protein